MKKSVIFCFALLLSAGVFAQSRKYISQFSHLQSYYNPGLTGYEGSMLRGLVRNQWAGWEGAPKTYFVSAELDFSQLRGESNGGVLGKNAVGINLLGDQYGAFQETELILSYASRIRLSKNSNLRLGLGLNYNSVRLDGTNLSTEQGDDPLVSQYLNRFAGMDILDFNLGIALTHRNYYLSYAVQNVNEGKISGGDIFLDRKPRVSIVQAGYRSRVSEQLILATNVMYRKQSDLPDNVELNVKGIILDKFWIGAGHRVNYANNFQFGLLLEKFRFGYVYELPILKSYLLPNTTHELMLTFSIFGNEEGERGMIW